MELKAIIMQQEKVEKYIATKNNKLIKHILKWYPNRYSNASEDLDVENE